MTPQGRALSISETGAAVSRVFPGERAYGYFVVAMLFLLLSGLYLWWPYKRVAIERRESSKRFWFDVHAAVGIFSFAFLMLLRVTGLTIGFERATTPMLYKITGSQPSPPPRAEIAAPPGARPITPDRAFQVARAWRSPTVPSTPATSSASRARPSLRLPD